jgi:hypothetical protein
VRVSEGARGNGGQSSHSSHDDPGAHLDSARDRGASPRTLGGGRMISHKGGIDG